MRPFHHIGLLVITAALLVTGCVERKERLSIEPDGTVAMKLEFAADSFEELFLGDAVPRVEGGWLAVEDVIEDDDGRKTYALVAEATFGPEELLPTDYATANDSYPDTVLQFPTAVTIERRRDGTYCHFHRVYTPRPWAALEHAREQLEEQVSGVKGRSFEDMAIQERAQLMQALSAFGAVRLRHFARQAFLDVLPEASQDHWLAMSNAIDESLDEVDHQYLANLVLAAQEEDAPGEAEATLQHELESLEVDAIDRMKQAMLRTGWHTVGRFNAFLGRLARHRTYHEITSELGDDEFEIVVTMPGEIVGHNGASRSGNTVTWEFNGKAMRDRTVELMASSRIR